MELTNEILEEYLLLSREVREKTKRLDAIRQACKDRGTFVTRDYACVVDTHTRVGLPSLDEVTKCIQRATLETLGLIRTIPVVSVRVVCRDIAQTEAPGNNL